MTDDNDIVSSNIYDEPPPKLANETSTSFNEIGKGLNLNTDRPQQNLEYYDNVRNDPNYNIKEPPRTNYNIRIRQISIDDNSCSTSNGPSVGYVSPSPPQSMQPFEFATPVAGPVVPFNSPMIQPVIVQANQPINNNIQPRFIVIQETGSKNNKSDDECCKLCLSSCVGFVVGCCLLMLCCGGSPRHGHRGW